MSDLDQPAVITCAMSGVLADRDQCAAIPYTPADYAAEARRIVDEGGVHIHIHARRPDGTPSFEGEDFIAIRGAILDEIGDRAIVNFSTGALDVPLAKRIAYLHECQPEVAALNMGSLNYAKYSPRRRDFTFSHVFKNPFEDIVELLSHLRQLGIKPEHECFDLGHIASLNPLIDMGLLDSPLHVNFVMGVLGGIAPSARNLPPMIDALPDGDPHWSLTAISSFQWPLVSAAAALGGSVRVGLEDNFYLPDGSMATSNGDLIAKARQIVENAGRRPATVEEARARLGLPAPAPAVA
jgi:3-keto-5-aminohexanoate cleavage enzyme